jgi:Acyl-CoA synthetases (AMP-forming)/AMP-acid ligases II
VSEVLTLPEFLEQGARRWPDEPWCRTGDGEATRAQVLASARRVAGGLLARRVAPGDRVVVVLPNGLDFLLAWFGIACAGAVTVAVNPAAAASELAAVAAGVQADVVVAEPGLDAAGAVSVTELAAGPAAPPVRCAPEDPVAYIQSSGSTGRPKFVIETHRMYTLAAEAFPWWLGLVGTTCC